MNFPPFLILIPETGPLNETGYTQQMFIDEGPVVHVIEGRMVTTIPIGRIGGVGKEEDDSDVNSDDTKTFLVAAGPSVKAIRTSWDGRYTALQRSRLHVEFIDHADIRQNTFIEAPLQVKDSHATLHGFFWTSTPRAEFVMVTSAGLEFRSFSPSPSSQGLISTGFQRLSNVCWFQWSQSTGILVLGCGSSGSKLQSFQFLPKKSSTSSEDEQNSQNPRGIQRLPLLDLSPPWGSPLTPISPSQVWILQLYGRIIIAYHERILPEATSTLHLYIIRGWDSIMPLMEKVLHNGGPIELSVVDDVVVIHFMNENIENAFSTDFIDVQLAMKHGNIFRPRSLLESPPPPISQSRADSRKDGMNMKLQLYHPDLAVNTDLGIFYRLKLDLNAIASACDDTELLIRFLASRTSRKKVTSDGESSDGSLYEQDPMHVLINVFRPLVARRAMPSTLRRAFEALISSSCRRNGKEDEDVGVVEIVLAILQPLLLQKDDTLIESAYYVQAIIAQFIAASVNAPNCPTRFRTIHPSIVDLYIKAYVLAGQSWLLDALFVRYAQLLDSKELADRLISHSPPVDDPTGCLEKLGVRMQARLNAM